LPVFLGIELHARVPAGHWYDAGRVPTYVAIAFLRAHPQLLLTQLAAPDLLDEIDESAERRRKMPSSWIVEAQSFEGRCPLLENTNEPVSFDVGMRAPQIEICEPDSG
jgi:hypothetical protein